MHLLQSWTASTSYSPSNACIHPAQPTFGLLPVDLLQDRDERDKLRARIAQMQQAASDAQPTAAQGAGTSGADGDVQAELQELTLQLAEARRLGMEAQREMTGLRGKLLGRETELEHYKQEYEG